MKTTERELILTALHAWINQRPALEYGNYGDPVSYRAEMRSITRDLHHARELLRAVQLSEGIDGKRLKEAFRAYSGRLTWNGKELDYCTGQYWPTEYRRAACAVLAAALWDYVRGCSLPATFPARYQGKLYQNPGEYLRGYFKAHFGRGIASCWFN